MHQSGIAENCSSVTTIKRSKANEAQLHNLADKTNSNNKKIKEMSSQIAESLYATQAKLAKNKKKNIKEVDLLSIPAKPNSQKSNLMKRKGKKEEFKKPLNHTAQNRLNLGMNRKQTAEQLLVNGDSFAQESLENSMKQLAPNKKKKMSEETYLESKSSITNVVKKKRKSLISKKWRREVKQQIDNEKLFKKSKEK